MLSVNSLRRNYGSVKAVNGLSFSVEKGEIFGLLGPNGAGKTTTIECILGTRTADSGSIELMGYHAGSYPKALFEKIGVQFQDSHYPDRIRVGELVELSASLYKGSGTGGNALLSKFGLSARTTQQVSDLSGGERQKLSIVLALVNNPSIVFFDELTTGLDPAARREVWSYMEKLKGDGLTIVLTSHFMDEVTRLCDRILIMAAGEEIAAGTPEEVKRLSGKQTLEDAYLYFTKEKEGNNENIIHAV